MSGFNLSKESFDGGAVQVAEGVWTVSHRYEPGGVKGFGLINNRGFIFKVSDEGGDSLLMYGIPGEVCVKKVKELIASTNLPLKLIVTSGDSHHMFTRQWMDAFPEARIIQSGLRFPHTRNGADILADRKYASRIELVEGPTFPSLQKYEATVKFFGFNQQYLYTDKEYMSKDGDNLSKKSVFGFIRLLAREKVNERALYIWAYHPASKTLITEHNWTIFFTREHYKQLHFLFRLASKPNQFESQLPQGLPAGPKDEDGCRIHCETMATVVGLDVRAATEFHSWPGQLSRKWPSKQKYQAEMFTKLKKAGEDDPTGAHMPGLRKHSCIGCGC